MVNMISGGRHAGGNLDFQDFLAIPVGAKAYREALELVVAVYHSLARVLIDHGEEGTLVGDEGGFGPKLSSNVSALMRLTEALARIGVEPRHDVAFAIDVASTQFFDPESKRYILSRAVRRQSLRPIK